LNIFYEMPDLFRRRRRVLGKLTDFIRDDGKAAAVFPRARGFDRRIERKQVRLIREVSMTSTMLLICAEAAPSSSIFATTLRMSTAISRVDSTSRSTALPPSRAFSSVCGRVRLLLARCPQRD